MGDLKVGDKVLASLSDGRLVFDDIYTFGHNMKGTLALASTLVWVSLAAHLLELKLGYNHE